MKPIVTEYTSSYFGVYFDDKQLRLLRRIASSQAVPVKVLICEYIRKGFAKLEQVHFSGDD